MKGLTLQFGFGKLFLLLGLVAMDKSHATLRVVYQTSTSCLIQEGAVYYNYQGTSPRRDIQLALNESGSQDDILVCAGTYTEALSVPPRTLTLRGEQNPNDPASVNITLLTKNTQDVSIITANGGPGEPVLTLRFLKLAGGLLPAGGNGGGAAISGGPWKLELENCLLEDNEAPHGGAIYLSSSFLNIKGSVFKINRTTSNQAVGGAISIAGEFKIEDSRFEGNSSHNGGAIGYFPQSCNVTSSIDGTVFEGNHATSSSGAINYSGHGLQCPIPLTISNSDFNNNWVEMNSAGAIGMIAGRLDITGTQFYSNSAPGGGGAIVSGSSVLTLAGCHFSFSTTSDRGGAILSLGSNSTTLHVNTSDFSYNTSVSGGGAILVEAGQLAIMESNFEGNVTDNHGAALKVDASSATVDRSTFLNNRQDNGGTCEGCAIIEINSAGAKIRNSLVYGNTSQSSAIAGVIHLINSTIYNNSPAPGAGGPYYQLDYGGSIVGRVSNSIVWHHDSFNGQVNSIYSAATVAANNSFIKGGWSGTDIYDVPPLVNRDDPANPNYYDFRLSSNSPAINKGDNGNVQPAETDLDGKPRIFGNPATDKVDVGAYEFQGVATSSVTITSNEQQGMVQPVSNGTVQVQNGSDLTVKIFTGARFGATLTYRGIRYNHDFRPYRISRVLLDGVPVTLSPIGSNGQQFTISNINESHAVIVEYETVTFDVVVNTTGGGRVFPDGTVKVLYGNDQTIQVRPSPGVAVTKITVDGEEISTGDLNSYRFTDVRENHAITFAFTSCNIENNINPSYVEEKVYELEGQVSTIYSANDGFGKKVQWQRKFNSKTRTNIVSGEYTDGVGRASVTPMKFAHTDGAKDFQFLNMGCLELVKRANQYYAPSNTEKGIPDGEGFAYYENEYYPDAVSGIKKGGAPGPVFTLDNTVYRGSRKWTFGVESDDDFFTPAQLNDSYLDERFESNAADAAGAKYLLTVARSGDNNFSQNISDNFNNVVRNWANPDNGDGTRAITSFHEIDLMGRTVSTIRPDQTQTQEIQYDKLGNVTAEIDPDRGRVESRYDKLGRLRFIKDEMQRNADIGSNIDHFTVTNYDEQDRITGVFLNNGTTGKFNKPEDIISESELIPVVRNFYGFLSQADLEGVGLDPTTATKILGELHNLSNTLSMSVSYYPSFDEASSAVLKIASITSKYGNDLNEANYRIIPGLPVQKTSYIYDARDKQVGMNYYSGLDGGGNWLLQSKKEVEYDINARVVGMKFDDKKLIEYRYNELGTMFSKDFLNKNGTLVETMDYAGNINGLPTKISTLGPDPLFSEIITYHDPMIKPGAGTERYGGKAQSLTFSYDNNGDRTDETKILHYDDASRLTKVEKNSDENNSVYDLDEMGRFKSKKEGGTSLVDFTYKEGTNQLTHISGVDQYEHPDGVNNFAYNLNGNLVLDRSKKMTIDYNYRGLPVTFNFYQSMPAQNLDWQDVRNNALGSLYTRVGFVKMAYNTDGERVLKATKIGNQIQSIGYVGDLAVFEGTNFNSMSLKYLNFTTPGGVTGKRVVSGGTGDYFYVKDQLQSVRAVVKEDGSVAEESDFAAYGDMFTLQPSSEPVRENWTGKELDRDGPGDGIMAYYFGSRYFDPIAGLWMTVDPISHTFSPYTFGGDPMNFTDPSGDEVSTAAIVLVGAIIGGTVAAVTSSIQGDAQKWEYGKEIIKGAAIGALTSWIGVGMGPNPYSSGLMSSMGWGLVTGTVTSSAALVADLAMTNAGWTTRTNDSWEKQAGEVATGALLGAVGGATRYFWTLASDVYAYVKKLAADYESNLHMMRETGEALENTREGVTLTTTQSEGALEVAYTSTPGKNPIIIGHTHPIKGDANDLDILDLNQSTSPEQWQSGGLKHDLKVAQQLNIDNARELATRSNNMLAEAGMTRRGGLQADLMFSAEQPNKSLPLFMDMVPSVQAGKDATAIKNAAVLSGAVKTSTGVQARVLYVIPISQKSRIVRAAVSYLWQL